MNTNSKVLPNFVKGLAVTLVAVLSTATLAEHHATPEKKVLDTLDSQKDVQIKESDIEVSPLSEEELNLKAENAKRMNKMTEIVTDEEPKELPE